MAQKLKSRALAAKPYSEEQIVDLPMVLNIHQAARVLNLPERSVYQLAGIGQVPGRRIARRWIFDRDEIISVTGRTYEQVLEAVLKRRAIAREISDQFGLPTSPQLDRDTMGQLANLFGALAGRD